MKRLLLLGFISVALLCQASDIIITTSSEQIKCTIDGKDETMIKFTTTDGGKYSLPISEVATLLYEDGRVEQMIYSQSPQPSATVSEDGYVQPITQSEATVQPINPYAATQTEEKPRWKVEEVSSIPRHEIVKEGKNYFIDDKLLPSDVYLRFLQKNCPKAYKQDRSWGTFFGTGLATFMLGTGLVVGGILEWVIANGSLASSQKELQEAQKDLQNARSSLADYQKLLAVYTTEYNNYKNKYGENNSYTKSAKKRMETYASRVKSQASSISSYSEKVQEKQEEVRSDEQDIVAGKAVFGVGVPVLAGGVVLLSCMSWSQNAYKTYNKSLNVQPTAWQKNPPLRLNVISHGNDIGLALAF